MFGPDIRARVAHQSGLDVYAARGGVLPRRGPAPRVTEVRAGAVIEGSGHVQPYLECVAYRIDSDEGRHRADRDVAAVRTAGELDDVTNEIAKIAKLAKIAKHQELEITRETAEGSARRPR